MAPELLVVFADLPDPREPRGVRHRLDEMLFIAMCAVVCGADDCADIAEFGRSKESWFKSFLELPHGIPSEDTFQRIFAALDPNALERCLSTWMKGWKSYQRTPLVAVDGKRLRRSFDRASGKAALHMVSAWATEAGLCLGQVAVEEGGNEITALPPLLQLLDLHGTTVSIDAIGCQADIAARITGQGGHYVLALKANQGNLYQDTKLFLDAGIARGFEHACDFDQQVDKDHGRIETRRVWVTGDIGWFADKERWPKMRTWAAVESERIIGDQTSTQRRYFISSLEPNAKAIGHAVRQHWQIENALHWVLDVDFAEDQSRLRAGHAAENMSRLKRIAISLLKQERSTKASIKTKRLRAGWVEDYLLKILAA